MADVEFRGAEYAPQSVSQGASQAGKITKIVNTAGAVMSVALVLGVGVWGYRLLVRDVSGVPVVRALDGPMRVQPADPGGEQTAHQGLSVNRVQASGIAAPTADRLLLAPVGAGITSDDQAGLRRPAVRAEATSMAEAAEVAALDSNEILAPVSLRQNAAPAFPEAGTENIAAATSMAPKPLPSEPTVTEAMAMKNTTAPLSAVPAVEPRISAEIAGVSRSPRPLNRPSDLSVIPATAPVEIVAARVVSAPATQVDATTIKSGTRLAQLGAYDSAEIAAREWDRLYGRFTEYLEGKSRVIQEAQSGGRTFYRLRAMGFEDLSDARRFCSALLAEKAACIPVKVR